MFVSLHLSPQSRSAADDAEIIEQVIATAVEGDRRGLASIGLTEHHLAGFNTYVDPFLLGARLSGQVEHAHLSITVAQVALHHPLRLVEKCNLLDVLTRGKCLIALAAGSASEVELGAFGISAQERSRLTEERIAAMERAWAWDGSAPGVDLSTSRDQSLVTARISPAPFRRRPVIARATRTPATLQRLGAQGVPAIMGQWLSLEGDNRNDLTLYADALASAPVSEEQRRECLQWLGFGLTIVVAPSQREAERRWKRYVEVGGEGPQPGRLGGATAWQQEWTHREVARASGSLVGDPDRIVEEILTMRDCGARAVRIIPAIAAASPEDRDEVFSLIYERILPHVDPERLPAPVPHTASSACV